MEESDIYYADLDPSVGHEQGGRRPVIIVKVLQDLRLCMVVPLTTVLKHLEMPYTIRVNSTGSTNLKEDSVALVFQMRTISDERMRDKIGVLEDSHLKKMGFMVKNMLGIA